MNDRHSNPNTTLAIILGPVLGRIMTVSKVLRYFAIRLAPSAK
jgi:hypothetical protein